MFWGLTLRELFREFVVGLRVRRDEFARYTLIGYQAVAIWVETQNKKRMPKFDSLIGVKKQPQSVQQMKSVLELMSMQMGVPLQKLKKRRIH